MNNELNIEKNIPIPDKKKSMKDLIGEMKVGDSFACETSKANGWRSAAHLAKIKILVRKLDNDVTQSRIWRKK